MSVRAGPASDGCAATEDVGEDSAEPEEEGAKVHLHVSVSLHSQGLRREVTAKIKFRDRAQRQVNTRITSKMKDVLFDLV
jgi:hypothetical protein